MVNIHEFGINHSKVLLMFHGACMTWDMYKPSIKILSQYFHVIIPALPGHDMTTDEDYTSVEQISREMEDWLLMREYKNIWGIYGLSMGGSLVIRFLADHIVSVQKAIIDGGITPYKLPWVITRLIAVRDYLMVQLGRSSKKLVELAFPPERYTEEWVDYMYQVMQHMTGKSIWRVFESCNNYPMPEKLPEIPTEIEYWYGEKEKNARGWDMDYVKKIYPQITFRELPGMEHGEYCTRYPQKFAEDLIKFLG